MPQKPRVRDFNIQGRIPAAWEEAFNARMDELGLVPNSYVKLLVARDLGLSDIPYVGYELSDEMFEDLHAAALIQGYSVEDLQRLLIQLHLESDAALLDKDLFQKRYPALHDYQRNGKRY